MSNQPIGTTAFGSPDYQEPTGQSEFVNLDQGQTKIRVLTPSDQVLQGWEAWGPNPENPAKRMPHRRDRDLGEFTPAELEKLGADVTEGSKYFVAMTVWNFNEELIQCWLIHQATIRKKLIALIQNPDWGELTQFDIVVTRTGEGRETEYEVMPSAPKALPDHIATAWEDAQDGKWDLARIMEGLYPAIREDD